MIKYKLKSGEWIDRKDVLDIRKNENGKRFAKFKRYIVLAGKKREMTCYEEIVEAKRERKPERYIVKCGKR